MQSSEQIHSRESSSRYQMEIITDKGKNWNGIYVIDKKTGKMKFYASSDGFLTTKE